MEGFLVLPTGGVPVTVDAGSVARVAMLALRRREGLLSTTPLPSHKWWPRSSGPQLGPALCVHLITLEGSRQCSLGTGCGPGRHRASLFAHGSDPGANPRRSRGW